MSRTLGVQILLFTSILKTTNIYISQTGNDNVNCGDISNPCGTLYYASTFYNSESTSINFYIEGQSTTLISNYVNTNNTNGYHPCLPKPVTYPQISTQVQSINYIYMIILLK